MNAGATAVRDKYNQKLIDNQIINQEKITPVLGVAILIEKISGEITIHKLPAPYRHDDLKNIIFRDTGSFPKAIGKVTEGFYSNTDTFITRSEAAYIGYLTGLFKFDKGYSTSDMFW